jgi:hypothetical protein
VIRKSKKLACESCIIITCERGKCVWYILVTLDTLFVWGGGTPPLNYNTKKLSGEFYNGLCQSNRSPTLYEVEN